MENLTAKELKELIVSVFSPREKDEKLAILIDVPDEVVPDNENWRIRRKLAQDWAEKLASVASEIGLKEIALLLYPNVHNNNADLPETAYFFDGDAENLQARNLTANGQAVNFKEKLSQTQLVIALTEFSATAPLKILAKQMNFRAATMPGFSPEMIPALRLDYAEINRRVQQIKKLLDEAVALEIDFTTTDGDNFHINFDLRFRKGHASGGRFPDSGVAGNLPSGESYIVPYEGEKPEKSLSEGFLPVQLEGEIVVYKIRANKAVEVVSSGEISKQESEKIQHEPAYANIAELGFGVLGDFGISPTGEILLDEKLGLHIAFGRSDHFGGAVGPTDFSSPENVVHIDRIYISEMQPDVLPVAVKLRFKNGETQILMKDGKYMIFS
ncbi:MAG: hypothetical protein GXO74_03770 [Calditrichaeota bacterium]|nr:hypothetical protein [Calditrichota bacterium]